MLQDIKGLHQQNVDPVGEVGVFATTALASLDLSQFRWEHLISLFSWKVYLCSELDFGSMLVALVLRP